jgi:hypothetical protein
MEKTAAELEAEKQAAEEAAKASDDTIDGGEGGDDTGTGVNKKDYLKMSQEEIMADLKEKHKDATPDQLIAEMAKQMQIIGHKNNAITALKKPKTPEAPKTDAPVDDLDKPITKRDLVEINNRKAVETMANGVTSDPKERQAILDAYNNDIVRTGDLEKDFKKSLAIANSGVVEDYKKNQSISRNNENYLTRFSGGVSYGGPKADPTAGDAVKRATAANLEKAGFTKEEIDKTLAKL